MKRKRGFTLIELVTVLVLLAILSAVAIGRLADLAEQGRREATREEMIQLRTAIVGNAHQVAAGQRVSGGYEGDVGSLPPDLSALETNPGVPAWDRFTRTGWHGPYINDAAGDYSCDAWGNPYQYDSDSRTLTSTGGGGTSITVTF